MELRNYQQRAVSELYAFLRTRSGNPVIVIPTGGGKTPVIATICKDAVTQWNGRVLIVAHVKELLEQSVEKLQAICPMVKVGVYSAGLGRRDTEHDVIVGGVQSIYDKAESLGRFDLMLADEVHLISEKSEGRYQTLIAGLLEVNPDMRIIGLTATPYRLDSGPLCKPDGILNAICYEIGVKDLIVRGFLSPIRSKAADNEIDSSEIKIVRGEYDDEQARQAFTVDDLVKRAVDEIVTKTKARKSVLVFCQTVEHAEQVAEALKLACESVKEIYGDTSSEERKTAIKDFREGRTKFLVNVNVLTTGFDAPNVDCVVLLRATVSPGLYYQIVGRGFRLCERKVDCLLLDFGENIKRHGPVDEVKAKIKGKEQAGPKGKKCPTCSEVVTPSAKVCRDCGHVFQVQPRELTHGDTASEDDPISKDPVLTEHRVMSVSYKVHNKKDAPPGHPRTLRVTYQIDMLTFFSEWICVEHPPGFARRKAESWWEKRSDQECPTDAEDAFDYTETKSLREPYAITVKVKPGERFPGIVGYKFREAGEDDLGDDNYLHHVPGAVSKEWLEEEIPF